MKSINVPPRRQPPRVCSLDDLKRFKSARRTVIMARGSYVHELTFSGDFVSSHSEYAGFFRNDKISCHEADVILRGFVFYAVRGASKEF